MRSILIGASALALLATSAHAAPWLSPDDPQVRQDVETLQAAGVIHGPVNAWPLPLATLSDVDAAAQDMSLPPDVHAAAMRINELVELYDQSHLTDARVSVTNDPSLIQDFGSLARNNVDASVAMQQQIGNLFVSVGVGYRRHQAGRDYHFEPSYAAYKIGNWALYGGYVDEWWGPGNTGALLVSTSARPIPKIGIKRLAAHPIDFPVLRWLGPWRIDAFVGDLGKRNDYDHTKVIGLRFDFAPAPGLEIGVNRALQLCGNNRPCGFKTISKALVGFGNEDNTGTLDEPGNQIAGMDISYTRRIGGVTAKVYGEAEAEDEDGPLLVDQFGWLSGLTLSGPAGDNGASWAAGVEFASTRAYEIGNGGRYRNGSFYNNFIYTDGYTYKGDPIGYSIDGDSKIASFNAAYTDARNRRFYGSFRRVHYNYTGANTRISANPETINIATLGVQWPTSFGDVTLEGRVQDNDVNTPGRSPTKGAVELGWRSRF